MQYQFTVPPKYALLEPTDVITITKDGASYVMRINSTKLVRNGMQELTAVAEDVSSYDFYNPAGTGTPNIQPPTSISATRLELLDLPAFPTDAMMAWWAWAATGRVRRFTARMMAAQTTP